MKNPSMLTGQEFYNCTASLKVALSWTKESKLHSQVPDIIIIIIDNQTTFY